MSLWLIEGQGEINDKAMKKALAANLLRIHAASCATVTCPLN